ncbi:hypothetical protein L227DRAFT_59459 [Lentinus tigrinus ALCF2SS1-6]|uniref:Uncharacterized protein n=1 Tax=Lentinus tigrinus ALCF2SS1-6 TaxID=1328759 RepID=A0A5C2SD88_9APHY|nr:hypothetical protein L227DRAFT_59459 [Lentinus tigrinus ALCF2SS1-6]
MAFCMPLNSETFYDGTGFTDARLMQDFAQDAPSTFFDYDAFADYDTLFLDGLNQDQFCIDSYQRVNFANEAYPPAPAFYPPTNHYSMNPATSMPQVDQPCISPAALCNMVETWFQSQVEGCDSYGSSESASSPVSSSTSQPSAVHGDTPTRSARTSKRKADDSDYEDDSDASTDCSEYAPRRPTKRPATARVAYNPLPDSLAPIRVQSATHPRCPMPGCGVELDAKDSAWRGHFKRVHHDALCLTPNCGGLVTGSCKARCPLPIPGCKSCASDDEHKHGHVARKGSGGAMTIESVGRHLLNVHIKVAYRCPLCGLQNEWRESACVRHIRRCAEKHGKKTKGYLMH